MGISSHRLPSGGAVRARASTVWRQVATGDRWLRETSGHRLPSGGALRGGLPPSGDRWLRATGGHRLPSGGALRGGLPPSGDKWLRATDGDGMCYSTEYPRQDSNLRPQL